MARTGGCSPRYASRRSWLTMRWRRSCRSIPRSCGLTSTRRALVGTQSSRTLRTTRGAGSNYTNSSVVPGEPPDHALSRSRGGLSTKIHALADQSCTPVVAALTGGQAGDNPMLSTLVKALAEGGYDQDFRLLADKAYSPPAPGSSCGAGGSSTPPREERPDRPPQSQGLQGRPTTRVRQRDLQAAQHHRTLIQPGQAVAWTGHPLRQVRRHLLGWLHARNGDPDPPSQPLAALPSSGGGERRAGGVMRG